MFLRKINIGLAIILFVGCVSQEALYKKAIEQNTKTAYKKFLRKYPTGNLALQIRHNLDYLYTQEVGTIDAYDRFLESYPTTEYR